MICIFSSFHFSRVILPISVEEVSAKCAVIFVCVCVCARMWCEAGFYTANSLFILTTRVMDALLVYKGLPLSFQIRSLSCMSVISELVSCTGIESFHLVLRCLHTVKIDTVMLTYLPANIKSCVSNFSPTSNSLTLSLTLSFNNPNLATQHTSQDMFSNCTPFPVIKYCIPVLLIFYVPVTASLSPMIL